jgi:hypothetical protein
MFTQTWGPGCKIRIARSYCKRLGEIFGTSAFLIERVWGAIWQDLRFDQCSARVFRTWRKCRRKENSPKRFKYEKAI